MRGIIFFIIGWALTMSGCTSRTWYEGMQQRQRDDCHKLMSQQDIRECLEKTDMTYDQYKEAREHPAK